MVEIQRCIFFNSLVDIVYWVSGQELGVLAIEKSLPVSLLNRIQTQNAQNAEILVAGYTRTTCPAVLLNGLRNTLLLTSPVTSRGDIRKQSDSMLAMDYVLHGNWVPIVRKCTKRAVDASSRI